MFQRIAMAAAVGLCCVCARAEERKFPLVTSGRHEEVAVEPKPSPATEATNRKLQEKIADVRLADVGIGVAFDQLRDSTGLDIFVNWKLLEAAGIDRNAPVSLHLKNKKLSIALDLILTVAGAEHEALGYSVDDGVVVVSTRADLDKNTLTRVYDVRDLLPAPAGAARDAQVAAVVKLLMDEIGTDTWRDHGGKIGAIRELQGQLIVTQTPENHARIVSLLDHVRPLLHATSGK
ncbi:MAG: hypothetical protein JWO87_271 [Phycisphaerales bacterium]|nr:hypothetical protein [Phycisphaerales bacterium]